MFRRFSTRTRRTVRINRILSIPAIIALMVSVVGITPAMAQSQIFEIRHSEMPYRFCELPNVYTAADLTQTKPESWLQLSLDQLEYTGGSGPISVKPTKDQYIVEHDSTGKMTAFVMFPDIYTGPAFSLLCDPSAEFEWNADLNKNCPDSIEEIAAFTHTDSSAWIADIDPMMPGITFYSSKQLSDYPMTQVTIDEIPQGVFISRRAAGAWDYDPLSGSDSDLTPGYRNVIGEIGFIRAICAQAS